MPLTPEHSRPRRIRSNRGLPQCGGLFLWKMMMITKRPQQRGGWFG